MILGGYYHNSCFVPFISTSPGEEHMVNVIEELSQTNEIRSTKCNKNIENFNWSH
jgi:hypothetical protein